MLISQATKPDGSRNGSYDETMDRLSFYDTETMVETDTLSLSDRGQPRLSMEGTFSANVYRMDSEPLTGEDRCVSYICSCLNALQC